MLSVYGEKWTHENAPVELPEGICLQWYLDDDFEIEGFCSYGSEEQDAAAEKELRDNLESGFWVVLGYAVETDEHEHLDSCWGIIVESTTAALVEYFNHSIKSEVPSPAEADATRLAHAVESMEMSQEILLRRIGRIKDWSAVSDELLAKVNKLAPKARKPRAPFFPH